MFYKLLLLLLGYVVVALLLTMVTGNVAVPLVLGVVLVVGVGVLEYLGESDSGSTGNSKNFEDENSEDVENVRPRISRRCPYCGSPIRIKGNRWECGYCGDCGHLSSLRR